MNVQFEYQITCDDYVEANQAFTKSFRKKRISQFLGLIVIGVGCLLIPLESIDDKWAYIFILPGFYFLFYAVVCLPVARRARRAYPQTGVQGQNYRAEFDDEQVQMTGSDRGWKMKWSAFTFKAESKSLYVFYCSPILYIFAKRYLSPDQEQALKKYSGLAP